MIRLLQGVFAALGILDWFIFCQMTLITCTFPDGHKNRYFVLFGVRVSFTLLKLGRVSMLITFDIAFLLTQFIE